MTDAHAHLNDERLVSEFDAIVDEANQVGVHTIINVGCTLDDARLALQQAEQRDGVYAAVGLHPHNADDANGEYYDSLIALAKEKKVVAYGEIGLDYHYDFSAHDTQIRVLKEQLEIANGLSMPVVIHLREAYQDMLKVLEDTKSLLTNGVLIHCYSGSAEVARLLNKYDVYYSFGGAITFAKDKATVLKEIPQDRLLLETDCPYMTPVPLRGKTNYPKYIPIILSKLSELTGIEAKELEALTDRNAKCFYRLK